MNKENYNQEEHFDDFAYDWWNKTGNYRLLHKLNPLRLEYITSRFDVRDKKILDIGCGGGILTEELNKIGAEVTGIDSSEKSIKIAKQHAREQMLDIKYINSSILEITNLDNYDCIVCFEMIEHVSAPNKLIEKIRELSSENCHLFMSTINRNLKSFIFAKIMAEYILDIVPKGTHQYSKFVTPYELDQLLVKSQFNLNNLSGIRYNPLDESFSLSQNTDINYFLHAQR
tara:strand:- start:377 stop:1063 length:687 start_codon:yes stop_codon:yes gene_type:complete